MQQSEKILMAFTKEKSLKRVTDMTGWSKGSTSGVIRQLIEDGFLRKTRHGFYEATREGLDQIRKNIEKDSVLDSDIDAVAYRTAALFTAKSRFSMIETLKFAKESHSPSASTLALSRIIKAIYLESLDKIEFYHCDDFVKGVWRHHREPVCKECGFDFNAAYENHAGELKRFEETVDLAKNLSKTAIFKNLRWESYPDIEKFKRNSGMHTSIAKSEIPEDWND